MGEGLQEPQLAGPFGSLHILSLSESKVSWEECRFLPCRLR